MRKTFLIAIFSICFLIFAQNILAQDDFYSSKFLKYDFKQVNVVVHVNVKSRELVNHIGEGSCEDGKGTGYCLYRLKADVKEIFKGKIEIVNFEFYTVVDVDYRNKDSLLGEKVVFLDWSDNYPDKKMSLGTMENSTRSIEKDVVKKLRKIAKKKLNYL
ncbi:MAG TPA: hypothetical protein PKE69_19495 [Pyrinomonadaceae bacterium]|nr:hypothetical protein [Pyrinomonadaceae bacterium]